MGVECFVVCVPAGGEEDGVGLGIDGSYDGFISEVGFIVLPGTMSGNVSFSSSTVLDKGGAEFLEPVPQRFPGWHFW